MHLLQLRSFNKEKLGKDALGAAFIEDSSTSTPTSATSHAFTPASTPASSLPDMYINIDLQRATRLALKLFVKGQEQDQAKSTP